MKILKFSLILSLIIIFFQQPEFLVAANQTASDSASQDKLKALEIEIASKASQLKDQISKKLQNKAYIGSLTSKNSLSIQINTELEAKTVKYNEFTQFLGKKVDSIDSFKTGDNIATLGDVDENGVMMAKEMIKLSSPPVVKIAIWGKVSENDQHGLVVQTTDNKNFNIDTNSDTDIHSDQGQVSLSKLSLNLPVIVSGIKTDVDKISATLIYIPPTVAPLKVNKESSSSATASPSATPKVTSTPTPKPKSK